MARRHIANVTAALLVAALAGRAADGPKSLAEIGPIDVHAHVFQATPALGKLLSDFNLHLINILVVDDRDKFFNALEPQFRDAQAVEHRYPGRTDLCTTFSPYDFDKPGFSDRVMRQLKADFGQGAVGVKIYKTIGMEIKTRSGKYLLPDDAAFDPIYEGIAAAGRTVVAHLAEPTSCWQAPNPKSPDYSYYKEHPEEYAYTHPNWPSKEKILEARDRVLAKHPSLRVVGAHLGSMELDVDEIAKRFDRYPNFAVDTAARIQYLMAQPREKVRAFLIQYQDRVLYGTDFDLEPQGNAAKIVSEMRRMYQENWKYFSSNQTIRYQGRDIQGLDLPAPVLEKLYRANAVRWFPGLHGGSK